MRFPSYREVQGTSLAGQAIGPGLIIDCSRHLDQIIRIDPESRTAVVEPGVILSSLNQAVEKLGLQPLLIESSAENLKVTFPADRVLAETILQARHETGRSTWVAQR